MTDCPHCTDERAAGAAFCESCGRPLATGAPLDVGTDCGACGSAGSVATDGYCDNCGMLAGRPRDHAEADAGPVAAAVTDRGVRHRRNEDAMWLAVRGTEVDVVVCDGVSSSADPEVASGTAAEAAGKALALETGVAAAVRAAAEAVAALAGTGDPRRAASNPACTIVAARVREGEIEYGWVGDSRAYWVPIGAERAEQLTEDDSWATHVIAMGADPQAAWNNPQAHAITAWLGADFGVVEPRTGTLRPEAPGVLVLCSDGLWNYYTEPAAFAEVVLASVRENADLVSAARALVALAVEAGGADNITVALIPIV
ncbi:PP2C family serine/threonine-protein phosphatase [Actinoplanes sp. N902-109]|uniref:PP2C family serine/threonine-protein phosphatase n=1 Tax=Actinoplanes sp. (strain N902-109) TaxID=649831 RepID=UPI000329477A|nr:protein phosphatase 2C domain-containing protein [Actinoplanes sp. N902-109]AGL18552.1 putative serine/threonine protein phosphatase [Actinoplanes sp. N902-109]